MSSMLDYGFDKPVPFEFDLVDADRSWIGVGIVLKDDSLAAICGSCRHMLGWTFDEKLAGRGYWSCLEGCKLKYKNELGFGTSSVTHLKGNELLTTWLSGWLGEQEFRIEVKIDE